MHNGLLAKFEAHDGTTGVGIVDDGGLRPLGLTVIDGLKAALDRPRPAEAVAHRRLLSPIDHQEVWGAGVTYERSRGARMDESEGAAVFYDRVYDADRPELFFKSTASRVAGPGEPVVVRADSAWTVPEPELGLWLDSELNLIGLGLGNDMSARDIEAENPLYLPQAKVYSGCCALGPGVLPTCSFDDALTLTISLRITRDDRVLYEGEVRVSQLHRRLQDLVGYLGRDNEFPDGVVLLTGTGIVPPDDVALAHGDVVVISGGPLGTLTNPVTKRG